MNKKDISIIIGVGALFTSAYSAYMLRKERESQDRLNKKIKRLARCHNNFVDFQRMQNDLTLNIIDCVDDIVDYLEAKNILEEESDGLLQRLDEIEEKLREYEKPGSSNNEIAKKLCEENENKDCDDLEERVN